MKFINKIYNSSALKSHASAGVKAYSWNMVLLEVQSKKKPLEGLIDL
jgi:hypothetical protein